jgi:hypothetical protein
VVASRLDIIILLVNLPLLFPAKLLSAFNAGALRYSNKSIWNLEAVSEKFCRLWLVSVLCCTPSRETACAEAQLGIVEANPQLTRPVVKQPLKRMSAMRSEKLGCGSCAQSWRGTVVLSPLP